MAKRKVEPKVDGGISAKQKQQIRTALRKIWSWSLAHKLVKARCLLPSGFSKCENPECKAVVAMVYVDHIERVGDVDSGMFARLFVSSKFMQGLCKKCHGKKTAQERADAKKLLKAAELEKDWYK